MDDNVEASFVRNQNMIFENLLSAEETRGFREQGIANRLESARNRAYSQVAIAPTVNRSTRWNLLNCLDLAPWDATSASLMLVLVLRLLL